MIPDNSLRIFRLTFGHCERTHGVSTDCGIEYNCSDPWPISCPECQCLLDMEYCWWCGLWYLKFGRSGDGIMREADMTATMDIMCWRCADEAELEERLQEDDDDCDDPYGMLEELQRG